MSMTPKQAAYEAFIRPELPEATARVLDEAFGTPRRRKAKRIANCQCGRPGHAREYEQYSDGTWARPRALCRECYEMMLELPTVIDGIAAGTIRYEEVGA